MDGLSVRELARRTFLREVDETTLAHGTSPFRSASELIVLDEGQGVPYIGDAVCSIGAFDGVHRGHRYLFSSMIADARRRGLPSVIVTFDPDPDELFLPVERVHKLLNNEDRTQYLRNFGADYVVSVPFTRNLASNNARKFMHDILGRCFTARGIHVGADFKLGAGNAGNVAELRKLGSQKDHACEVCGYDLLCNLSAPVSATRVRKLLMEEGDCETAAELLCRCHFVRGTVTRGRMKGRTFGFPTANVHLDYPYVVPAEGVYGCLVLLEDGTVWPSATNVGVPRTFASEPGCASIEANLLGFDGDIYDTQVAVAFVKRLRGQRVFTSQAELEEAIGGNVAWVEQNLGTTSFVL